MDEITEKPTAVLLPNSEQFYMKSEREDYLIQISWPLGWQNGHHPDGVPVPIIYIVDGNALFLTATQAAWRRAAESRFGGGGIIVAIGYPLSGKLYDSRRRSFDLTPPTTTPICGFGGADLFLDFIENSVKPKIRARFPQMAVSREALYGHSYGGLFALHALFTRTHSFDCYIASSPSIWWNDNDILHEAESFLKNEQTARQNLPSLMVFWGSLEQNPCQWDNEALDKFEERKRIASIFKTTENSLNICKMLRSSKRLHTVLMSEFEGEEHTSVMACSTNRSLTMFFEDWPLRQS